MRFTNSEAASDRHELIIQKRTMRPSIARDSEQYDAPNNHTKPLFLSYYFFPCRWG